MYQMVPVPINYQGGQGMMSGAEPTIAQAQWMPNIQSLLNSQQLSVPQVKIPELPQLDQTVRMRGVPLNSFAQRQLGLAQGGPTQTTKTTNTQTNKQERSPEFEAALQEQLARIAGLAQGMEGAFGAKYNTYNDVIRSITNALRSQGSSQATAAGRSAFGAGLGPLEAQALSQQALNESLREMFSQQSMLKAQQADVPIALQQALQGVEQGLNLPLMQNVIAPYQQNVAGQTQTNTGEQNVYDYLAREQMVQQQQQDQLRAAMQQQQIAGDLQKLLTGQQGDMRLAQENNNAALQRILAQTQGQGQAQVGGGVDQGTLQALQKLLTQSQGQSENSPLTYLQQLQGDYEAQLAGNNYPAAQNIQNFMRQLMQGPSIPVAEAKARGDIGAAQALAEGKSGELAKKEAEKDEKALEAKAKTDQAAAEKATTQTAQASKATTKGLVPLAPGQQYDMGTALQAVGTQLYGDPAGFWDKLGALLPGINLLPWNKIGTVPLTLQSNAGAGTNAPPVEPDTKAQIDRVKKG